MIFLRKSRWQKRYVEKSLPWVTNRPDFNLQQMIEEYKILPCSVLEIGCGYGDNSIWLAKQGFEVSGIDLSAEAIKKAKKNADKEGVDCNFYVLDFMKHSLDSASFDFIFDRGCFHSRDFKRKRKLFSKSVFHILKQDGFWLSLIGSKDTPEPKVGPPKLSVLEIARSVEHKFKIIDLKTTVFDSEQERQKKAWCCLMQRR